jgi:hypothetical protein
MSGAIQVLLYERERQENQAYLAAREQVQRSAATLARYRSQLLRFYCPRAEADALLPRDIQTLIVSYLDHSLPIGAIADVLSPELQWRQAFVMDVALFEPPEDQLSAASEADEQAAAAGSSSSESSADPTASTVAAGASTIAPARVRRAPVDLCSLCSAPNILLTVHYEQVLSRASITALDAILWRLKSYSFQS